jgi:hypothetical protein
MITNLTTLGFSGFVFGSPLPIETPGPPESYAFAGMNVAARFIHYFHVAIPFIFKFKGVSAGAASAGAGKAPRLSMVKNAEDTITNAKGGAENARKKTKEDENNARSNPLRPNLAQPQDTHVITLTVPKGYKAGKQLTIITADGRTVKVIIPKGKLPGMAFTVNTATL